MSENRSKWVASQQESGGKPIEITENWLRRFRMEGGEKKHLKLGTPQWSNITQTHVGQSWAQKFRGVLQPMLQPDMILYTNLGFQIELSKNACDHIKYVSRVDFPEIT